MKKMNVLLGGMVFLLLCGIQLHPVNAQSILQEQKTLQSASSVQEGEIPGESQRFNTLFKVRSYSSAHISRFQVLTKKEVEAGSKSDGFLSNHSVFSQLKRLRGIQNPDTKIYLFSAKSHYDFNPAFEEKLTSLYRRLFCRLPQPERI